MNKDAPRPEGIEELRTWLSQGSGRSQAQLARDVGDKLGRRRLGNYLCYRRRMPMDIALLISAATGGEVAAHRMAYTAKKYEQIVKFVEHNSA